MRFAPKEVYLDSRALPKSLSQPETQLVGATVGLGFTMNRHLFPICIGSPRLISTIIHINTDIHFRKPATELVYTLPRSQLLVFPSFTAFASLTSMLASNDDTVDVKDLQRGESPESLRVVPRVGGIRERIVGDIASIREESIGLAIRVCRSL